jgi:hypothetical protein
VLDETFILVKLERQLSQPQVKDSSSINLIRMVLEDATNGSYTVVLCVTIDFLLFFSLCDVKRGLKGLEHLS